MPMKGKVAVITGVSSGLGRGIATVFARQGASVLATARRTSLGEELEREVRAEGGELTFFTSDVSQRDSCDAAIAEAVARYGRIDVLVNNAGIEGEIGPIHETSDDDWRSVMSINLDGVFYMMRAAIPHMIDGGGGSIINISSINGSSLPLGWMTPYNTSKAAVIQLSKSAAVEYLAQNIRCNAIIMGGVYGDTAARTQVKIAKRIRGEDFERADQSEVELGFLMQPEAVGEAIAVLAGDAAKLITGAAIPIDRAMTAGLVATMMVHMTSAQIWTMAG